MSKSSSLLGRDVRSKSSAAPAVWPPGHFILPSQIGSSCTASRSSAWFKACGGKPAENIPSCYTGKWLLMFTKPAGNEQAAKSAQARAAPGGVPETAATAPPGEARSKAKDCEKLTPPASITPGRLSGDALFENTKNKMNSWWGRAGMRVGGPCLLSTRPRLEAGEPYSFPRAQPLAL